ncbi:MAG: hypothetical protein MK105_07265 [Crocinitomicaceae bacterium]|nr:hypothetical protein [Crocinitomicaceae bacterium]
MKVTLILLFALLLASCGNDFGSKVVGGNLSVYYVDSSDKLKAEALAMYWRENDLISGEQQDLQLVNFEDGYELRIIAKTPKGVKKMPFNERKLLSTLQGVLRDSIPLDGLEIVLCDSNFKPIYNINE